MNPSLVRSIRGAAAGIVLALGAACTTLPADPEERAAVERLNDPAEPTNREVYAFDRWLDRRVLEPIASAYAEVVPAGARRGIHNVLGNVGEPFVAANDLLQGNVTRFWIAFWRFGVNSTIGVGGVFDVAASDFDLPGHTADLGQTFGVWGIGEGPYLYLPVLGPSNLRDALGLGLTAAANPLVYVPGTAATIALYGEAGMRGVDTRSRRDPMLDDLERESIDYYAALRAAYRQYRAARIDQARSGAAETHIEFGYPGLSND